MAKSAILLRLLKLATAVAALAAAYNFNGTC